MRRPDSYTPSNSPTADYPYGSYKDETAAGAGDGTPIQRDQGMDSIHPWLLLLQDVGATPNNLPEVATNNQALAALSIKIRKEAITVIGDLHVSGGNVILDESILFGTTITQQNLGAISGLTASAWYFLVIKEDDLTISLQAFSTLVPTTPAGWSPNITTTPLANQLDLLPFYDKNVNYPRYETGGNGYRILYIYQVNSGQTAFAPNTCVKFTGIPLSKVILSNSANQAINDNTEVFYTLNDIDIDLLSEISGSSTARVYTAKLNQNITYNFDCSIAVNNAGSISRTYYNSTIYRERREENNSSTEDNGLSIYIDFDIAKDETLETKIQKDGINSIDINAGANTRATMLTIVGNRER